MPNDKIEILLKARDEATATMAKYKTSIEDAGSSLVGFQKTARTTDREFQELTSTFDQLSNDFAALGNDVAGAKNQFANFTSAFEEVNAVFNTGFDFGQWLVGATAEWEIFNEQLSLSHTLARQLQESTQGKRAFANRLAGISETRDDRIKRFDQEHQQAMMAYRDQGRAISNLNRELDSFESKFGSAWGRGAAQIRRINEELKIARERQTALLKQAESAREGGAFERATQSEDRKKNAARLHQDAKAEFARRAALWHKQRETELKAERKTQEKIADTRKKFGLRLTAIDKQIAEEREKVRTRLERNLSGRTGDPTLQSRTLSTSAGQVRSPLERQVKQSDRIVKLNEKKVSLQERMITSLEEIQRNTENQFVGV